jgi:hypothetical protein
MSADDVLIDLPRHGIDWTAAFIVLLGRLSWVWLSFALDDIVIR